MRRVYCFLFLGMLFLAGCGNVKDLKFAENNKEEIMQKIQSSKDLTGEENQLLATGLLRLTVTGQSIIGKRVGDIINDQKKFQLDIEAKEKEAKRLADEAAKKEAELAAELIKYVSIAPFKKRFRSADFMSGDYEDKVIIDFVFENKGPKDIKAFKGTGKFKDLFGEVIRESEMTYDEGIKSGSKVNWTGALKYNQFMASNTKFRDTDLANMKFEWVPKAIIFSDGSKLGVD